MNAQRKQGRQMKRWEAEINNIIKKDTEHENQQSKDLIHDDTWLREAKDKEARERREEDHAQIYTYTYNDDDDHVPPADHQLSKRYLFFRAQKQSLRNQKSQ